VSDLERRAKCAASEPPSAPKGRPARSRWRRRLQRAGVEAGISLIRGAATAAGGTLVTLMAFWIQSRL
jgi:hypothetical protein